MDGLGLDAWGEFGSHGDGLGVGLARARLEDVEAERRGEECGE